jgi:Formate-tetrahydrofolate ligase (EC 6.3.4.3)
MDKEQLKIENVEAVKAGIANLAKHIDTVRQFGVEPIVALNRFVTDTEAEMDEIITWCQEHHIKIALTNVWEEGGAGGIDLAKAVLEVIQTENHFKPIYDVTDSIENKVRTIVQKVYGGRDVNFTDKAWKQMVDIEKFGWDTMPICMAKTQYSLSDQPKLLGRPEGFTITVREIIPKLGAKFLVCLTGDIMTMPGLPKAPAALKMDVDDNGNAIGLF